MRLLLAQKLSQEESNFIQIRKTEQHHENYQICHRSSHRPEGQPPAMKKKTLSLAAGFAALLFASSCIASTNPVISSSSENSVRISDARVVRAVGGGSYVTGMIEPSFGYAAPRAVAVHASRPTMRTESSWPRRSIISTPMTWSYRIFVRVLVLPMRCSFPGNPLKSPRSL